MKNKYIQDVKTKAIFSPDKVQPQILFTEGELKVVTVGLEAGQSIPAHPEGLAVYTFLEGQGVMIVDGERMAVKPGATIITQPGALRGVEAESKLIFVGVRITTLPD
jgi:quercetin dioxygenase-like cupin family protein